MIYIKSAVNKFNLTWIFAILSFYTFAQSPYFTTLTLDKNVKQFKTYKIFQDTKGYIWFATSSGLYKHDGIQTIKYTEKDSIDQSTVTAIAEDFEQRIWIGHKNGKIEILQNGHFVDFSPEEGLPSSEITFIYFDTNNTLWFGTLGEGIYYYTGQNRKRVYNISTDDNLNDNYTYTITQCKNGRIYIGTDYGIAIIDTSTKKVAKSITMKNGLPDNIVKHLVADDNLLWIGMDEGGIALFDITKDDFTLNIPWKYGQLNNFTLKNNHECWISTKTNGLIKVYLNNNIPQFKQYSTKHGLKSNQTHGIFTDRENNIWLGEETCIIKSSASPFEFLDKRDGVDFGNTYSFINDRKGNYWLATEKGLIRVEKNKTGDFVFNYFKPDKKEASTSFISLFEDSLGFIWAGTYGFGAYRINPEDLSFNHFNITNGLPDNNVIHITGKNNLIWFSTLGGGASKYNIEKKTFESISVEEGLPSSYIYSIYIDSDNNTWFAMDGGGIARLSKNKLHKNIIPDSLEIRTVYGFAEDKSGKIWFTSAEKGLAYINNGVVNTINSQYLKVSSGRSICVDDYDNVVLIGNEAIQVFSPNENGFITFAEDKGVAMLEPNLNGIFKDNSGIIWVSTKNGILSYNPSINASNTLFPKVNLESVLLFFQPIQKDKTKFKFRQNHFTFEYAGLWLQSPENITYRHKLENYDFDWSRPSQTRNVTYSNLPPGEYTFIVEVSHKPGFWTGSPNASYKFTIRPPFYKTWWFIISCVVFIALVIYTLFKQRIAKLERDKEKLELEVQKRTATILQQKEEIESQHELMVEQNIQISKQNKDITASIHYASRIQDAIFPSNDELYNLLGDSFVYNKPMGIVSGDFYWVMSKDDEVILAVADCTGHGVPGAFMSVLGISLLNKIAANYQCCKPEELLNALRSEVKLALHQTGKTDEAKDGMDMALVQFNKKNRTLNFAGANNPAYIVRDTELIALPYNHMPIGVHPKETPFEGNSIQLMEGDMLYVFSDGYADQLSGGNFKKFNKKNFKELLISIAKLPCNEQINKLDEVMANWKNGSHQNDDILIIGIRF